MGDIRHARLIRFRDGTMLGTDQSDPRLLLWACLGRVLSSPGQRFAPLASWEAVAEECQRELDFIAGQLLAAGTSDFQYQRAADELVCWCEENLDLRVPPPAVPKSGSVVSRQG